MDNDGRFFFKGAKLSVDSINSLGNLENLDHLTSLRCKINRGFLDEKNISVN